MHRRFAPLLLLLSACAASPTDTASEPAGDARPPRPAPSLVGEPGASAEAAAGTEAGSSATPAAAADADAPPRVPAGWIAGRPLEFEEMLLEWHRSSPREMFLVVEKLVSTRLAFAEADRLGIRLDPVGVEAEAEAQIARFKMDVAAEGGGRSVEEFVRSELGVDPERYWARIREGTIRQMLAERCVRSWAFENDNATVRLLVVREEAEAADLRAQLEAGADFAALAREHSVDESGTKGGLLPYLVEQEHSPLTRVVFAASAGDLLGPVPAAGHFFLVEVVELREERSGRWALLEDAVEASLRQHQVTESEFLHWKLAMERRYPVDLAPLLELIGAPGSAEPSGEEPRQP
ncbi:MAG: peptidylprolyl isomerase [Planctomycetota bacterium]